MAERLYCSARLAPLQALWDSYTPSTPFVTWLPGFYDQVGEGGLPASACCQSSSLGCLDLPASALFGQLLCDGMGYGALGMLPGLDDEVSAGCQC